MKALLGGVAAVALGAGLLAPIPKAEAQTAPGTFTTQTGFRADAATFFQQTAGGSASCTASNASTANNTITITPPAGNYVYLTGLYITVGNVTSTGATSNAAWTATNMTGSPVWDINLLAGTTSGPALQDFELIETYPTALKSASPGVSVNIVPNATFASAVVCGHAVGYYNPF